MRPPLPLVPIAEGIAYTEQRNDARGNSPYRDTVGFLSAGCVGALQRLLRPRRLASISFMDWLKVEISEIHVAIRDYVYGEDIFSFAQTDFEKLWRQIPMVPLTPGKRVGRIIGCGDPERPGRVLSIHID
jgi:hypothetical protein